MADLAMPPIPSSNRRVATVGIIRQRPGVTTRIIATPIGATGRITRRGTCTHCHGRGGTVETTHRNGVHVEAWRRCTVCRGTGGAR